jgi:2-oxoglutarate ferredoxin oxidoreductase subunit gamma
VAKEVLRILIAGEGGQGVQTVSHVLVEAAFSAGLHVSYMPNYGVEQRGGVSLGFLQVGTGIIGFPKFSTADIIVNMRERAVDRIARYVGPETLYIYDSDLISGQALAKTAAEKLPIAATTMASDKLSPEVFNMILAGALMSELKVIPKKAVEEALEKRFEAKYKKKPQLRNLNKKALEIGEKLAKEVYAKK